MYIMCTVMYSKNYDIIVDHDFAKKRKVNCVNYEIKYLQNPAHAYLLLTVQ